MAIGVVDLLEVVRIDHDEHQRPLPGLGFALQRFEASQSVTPISVDQSARLVSWALYGALGLAPATI